MNEHEPFEVEFIPAQDGAGNDPDSATGPEQVDDQLERPSRLIPLLAITAIAGVAALLTFGGDERPEAAPETSLSEPADPADATTTSAPTTPQPQSGLALATCTPSDAAAPTEPAETTVVGESLSGEPAAIVDLRPGAHTLSGRIVLVPSPDEDFWPGSVVLPAGDEGLWVIEDGEATARSDLPAGVSVLVTSSGLAYAHLGETVVETSDATCVLGFRRESVPSYLLPGAHSGEAWALTFGRDEASATRISVTGEDAPTTTSPASIGSLAAIGNGVADGIIVWQDSGKVGLWGPGAGTSILESASDVGETGMAATSGDLVALTEFGRSQLVIIDVAHDQRLFELPTANDVALGCFSPDRRYLALNHFQYPDEAVVDSIDDLTAMFADSGTPLFDQRVTLVDLAHKPPQPDTFTVDGPVIDLTWAADGELVLVLPDQLLVMDLTGTDRAVQPVAELAGVDRWSVASAADTC